MFYISAELLLFYFFSFQLKTQQTLKNSLTLRARSWKHRGSKGRRNSKLFFGREEKSQAHVLPRKKFDEHLINYAVESFWIRSKGIIHVERSGWRKECGPWRGLLLKAMTFLLIAHYVEGVKREKKGTRGMLLSCENHHNLFYSSYCFLQVLWTSSHWQVLDVINKE